MGIDAAHSIAVWKWAEGKVTDLIQVLLLLLDGGPSWSTWKKVKPHDAYIQIAWRMDLDYQTFSVMIALSCGSFEHLLKSVTFNILSSK